MTKTKKVLAVLLTAVMLSGALVATATATPDEWISENGPYLSPAGKNIDTAVNRNVNEGYVVRKGDTLLGIAGRFGLSATDLASVNNLKDVELIREGQVIFVPGVRSIHTVASGESLSVIAQKSGISVKDITSANGLKNQDLLLVGQKLLIPGGSGSMSGLPGATVSRGLPVGELEWPVVGWVSSPFGMRDGKPHEGVDIAADHGSPIKATMSGRVIFAGPRGSYGLAVILDHGDGLSTLYAHSSKILVSEGEWVNKGQLIALVGNTGRSLGPHLHMEMLVHGVPYDPLICLNRART